MRQVFVQLHRWVGLATAGLLIIVGFTGSLLAFNTELERVFAPQLFSKAIRPGPRLDLATLAEKAAALTPAEARVVGITNSEPDQVFVYVEARSNPETRKPYDVAFDELYLDPWTGAELGRRKRGDLSQGVVNLMPFLYGLHWRLALGDTGQWILAVTALAWTIDCFIAFYLTLPQTTVAFWRRWKPAWLIKRKAGFYRLNFDLHRASGLWLWALLFIFAWSSVMMDWRPAYEAVTRALFDYRSVTTLFDALPTGGNGKPTLDWRAALATGERLMVEQSRQAGFTVGQPLSLSYVADQNVYFYEVRGSRDVFERSSKGGGTSVMFDAGSGRFLELSQPTGERAGNTVESWLYALHMARVFGMPYRLLVCALGLVIVALSVTGIYIWWKKRAARRARLHAAG